MNQANSDRTSEQRLEEAIAELEDKYRQGQKPDVADLLDRYELAQEPSAAVELIYADFRASRELGASTSAEAYLHQFPQYKQQLNKLFALQKALDEVDETFIPETPSPSIDVTDDTRTASGRSSQDPDRVGPYRILELIGRGGMGVVYKARHQTLERVVALKMMVSGAHSSPEALVRFQAEAEAAAKLDHPGIVTIYEIGEHDSQPFIAMKYVEGSSLAELVATGPMETRRAASILSQVAEAIGYAHERQVIHRDLKPSNILIDLEGNAVVTDFGLAKIVDGSFDLTATGDVLGTPSYMAPEQAQGEKSKIGNHTDVYALGAILYCMLTGRPPFQSASITETLRQVMTYTPVSPKTLNPGVDVDLETLCMRCLDKAPESRCDSAVFLAEELRRYLNHEPIRSRRSTFVETAMKYLRHHPLESSLIICVALVLVLSGVLIASFTSRSKLTPAPSRYSGLMSAEMLCLVAITGPYYSLSRIVGEKRVRTIEKILLLIGAYTFQTLSIFGLISLQLVLVIVFFASLRALSDWLSEDVSLMLFGGVIYCYVVVCQHFLGWRESIQKMTLLSAAIAVSLSLCALGSAWVLFAFPAIICLVPFFVMSMNAGVHFQSKLLWSIYQHATNQFRSKFGWAPWPFSMVSKEYNFWNGFKLAQWFPVHLVLFAAFFGVSAIAFVVLFPIFVVEWLRKLLTPQRPILSDLFAYLASILALSALGARTLGLV